MKLNTRLIIIFFAIVILPFVLAALTYFIICSSIVWNMKQTYDMDDIPLSAALNPSEVYSSITDRFMGILEERLTKEDSAFKGTNDLQEIDKQLDRISSFVVLSMDDEIIYINSDREEDPVLDVLSASKDMPTDIGVSQYYNDLHRVIKVKAFTTPDGREGCIYIVTCVGIIVSEISGEGILISIVLVLVLTGILLTSWVNQGIIKPMIGLKEAMKRIEKGDFDTPAYTAEKGEIGELYEGFEKMRLRLKGSLDERIKTEEANKELVTNISHDLKTPITSIKGYVEGIMDGVADTPEKMEKYIKTIYNKAGDMDFLIDELTMYSKIDANQIPYRFHRMNVGDYFGDCAEEVGLDLGTKGIAFEFKSLCDNDSEINADPEQLKRVINNIINNSVKYRKEENSKIILRISNKDLKNLLVEIEDNGKGISEKEAEKVFDRFYRTDASRNSKQGGSGIGLSIARKVVEDHNGTIWATGKENEGMTVHFTLPFYVEEPEVTEIEETSNNPIIKLEKMIGKTVETTVAGVKTGVEKAKAGVEKTRAEIEKKTKRSKGEQNEQDSDH